MTERNVEILTGEIEEEHEIVEKMDSQNIVDESKYLEMLKRLKAEFENYKKRIAKERLELSAHIKSELISKLLPVLDDFHRLFENCHENECADNDTGMKLIYDKLFNILRDEGLEKLESVGAEFNPEYHEAVQIEQGDGNKDNQVLEEWQAGYLFKQKLLRPAKVKVYKLKHNT